MTFCTIRIPTINQSLSFCTNCTYFLWEYMYKYCLYVTK